MSNWSSSKFLIQKTMTNGQLEILDVMKKNGRVTVSDLSRILKRKITGDLMFTLQVAVLEEGERRIDRKRKGRFIYWELQEK